MSPSFDPNRQPEPDAEHPAPAPPGVMVRVPASTSNLGPGFDCLGLALKLYNDFTVRVLPLQLGPHHFQGMGTAESVMAENNPFVRAFDRVYVLAGEAPPVIEVKAEGRIPVGRGLGSSASAAVAGALAADYLLGQPFAREELLGTLIELEGHPDNVTPALLGGLTLTALTDQGPLAHVYAPAAGWRLALIVPDYTAPTDAMREALPRKVKRADAVFNLARLPMLIDALVAGDAVEAGRVLEDRLHEAARSPFIKRFKRLRKAALDAGAAAVFISGSGPALAALTLGPDGAEKALAAMREALDGASFKAEGLIVEADTEGARVAELD